jgi:asparagine synthetase B (glutamine-hydrolysing)
MTLHAITAFVDAAPDVVDAFQKESQSQGRDIQRVVSGDRVAVLADGDTERVLRTWVDGDRLTVAFGSAVPFVREPQQLIGRVVNQKTIRSDVSDLVALHAARGEVLAITGNGVHRLYRRDLPSGGSVISSHLASTVTAETPASIDRSYEDFLLGFGFLPDGRTMFRGVVELPAPSILEVTNGSVEKLTVDANQDQTSADLLDALLAAVEQQSAGVDQCAVFLGGFDSALVCALLRKLGKQVTAYTFDFGDPAFNQTHTQPVVHTLGIEHRWVSIDVDRMREAFQELPNTLNSPGAVPHYQLHTVLAAEDMQRDGLLTGFTGDGCDALFLGYPTIRARSSLMSKLRRVPRPVASAMKTILGGSLVDDRLGHVARTARSVMNASMLDYPASGHLPTQYLDEVSLRRLRNDDVPPASETVAEIRMRLASGMEGMDPTRLAFVGNAATGASRVKVDSAIMRTGVAQYTPYKDPSVVQEVMSLPESALLPQGSARRELGKQYLIDAVLGAGLLPKDVVLQPKQSPVTSPIDSWYMNELRPDVMELLESLPFEWDRGYVENLLRPKRAEEWFRNRIALSPHALQAVGMLITYAAFSRLST